MEQCWGLEGREWEKSWGWKASGTHMDMREQEEKSLRGEKTQKNAQETRTARYGTKSSGQISSDLRTILTIACASNLNKTWSQCGAEYEVSIHPLLLHTTERRIPSWVKTKLEPFYLLEPTHYLKNNKSRKAPSPTSSSICDICGLTSDCKLNHWTKI